MSVLDNLELTASSSTGPDYSSLSPEALQGAVADAKASGFDVIVSTPSTLLLDLDSPEALAQYNRVLPVVKEHFGPLTEEVWRSKSGNTHVRLTLTFSLDAPWRAALSAALGSDGKREALNLVTQLIYGVYPAVLFKPKS